MIVVATVIMTTLILFLALLTFLVGSRQRKRDRIYLQLVVQERETAMLNISNEVHDDICQIFHVARRYLDAIREVLPGQHQQLATDTREVLDKGLANARNISHSMNPFYFREQGLVSALEEKLNWLNGVPKMEATLHIQGDHYNLNVDTELIIFRIAQEALNNIVKHAAAENIGISLIFHPSKFTMVIMDDGCGFSTGDPGFKEGAGMINMKQRAALIKGSLVLTSEKGEGLQVILTLPVKRERSCFRSLRYRSKY